MSTFALEKLDLIAAIGAGDEQAFTDFVNANHANVLRFAEHLARKYGFIKNQMDVEAAVQETFQAFWDVPRLPENEELSAYFAGILKRKLVDEARAVGGATGKRPIPFSIHQLSDDGETSWERFIVDRHRPAEDRHPDISAQDVLPLAEEAVRSIKGKRMQRAAWLHYLEGANCEQIAKNMGIKPSTVGVHLHSARRTILQNFPPSHPHREIIEQMFCPNKALVKAERSIT